MAANMTETHTHAHTHTHTERERERERRKNVRAPHSKKMYGDPIVAGGRYSARVLCRAGPLGCVSIGWGLR